MPKIDRQQAKARPKRQGALSRISQINFDDEGLKMNFYGRSGTGKTTLWGTWPGKILAMVCSGGGELRSINTAENRKRIEQLVIESSQDVADVIRHQAETAEYDALVLDHATSLQDMVLAEILGIEELPAQKGWGMASQQQYGQCTLQMKTLLRKLLELKGHVIIVAQEREFNTDDSKDCLVPYVASALSPSLVGWLNPACDYICETFIREQVAESSARVGDKTIKTVKKTGKIEFCLRTAPDPTFTTKFRLPKGAILPEVIVDPSYDKIMAVIRGEYQC